MAQLNKTMNAPQLIEILCTCEDDQLFTASEVAILFRIDSKTVVRWAKLGKIAALYTPGGRTRYRASELKRLFTLDLGNQLK